MQREISLSITPFTSEIVGADTDYVYFKERAFSLENYDCIIKVKRDLYLKLCNLWLDSKADFNMRYGHFCGVFGNFEVEEYKEVGKTGLLVDGTDDEEVVYEEVPIYEVTKFSEYCDMEHG